MLFRLGLIDNEITSYAFNLSLYFSQLDTKYVKRHISNEFGITS